MFNSIEQNPELELLPEFEVILNESKRYPSIVANYGYNVREFEGGHIPVKEVPKTIWRANTDLNAPYFGGNFNFLYNGGSNEALVTFNTYLSFRKKFLDGDKKLFIDNLDKAVKVWDSAAEFQIRDVSGNYTNRIKLRFKLAFIKDPRNANKRTDVHPNGTRATWFMDKGRENVMRELNVFIGSSRNVLVHELGHVWGLLDEYKDRWISMKLSLGHVGSGSPLLNDKKSIMNEGYVNDSGEFRTRFFSHFGRAILHSFMGLKNYTVPIKHGGKVISHVVYGRIALLKRDIAGSAPHPNNVPPFNPQFTTLQVARLKR